MQRNSHYNLFVATFVYLVIQNCEVPLVVDVARPTERSLFGETTQFVYRALDQSPVDRPLFTFQLLQKGYSTAVEYPENF